MGGGCDNVLDSTLLMVYLPKVRELVIAWGAVPRGFWGVAGCENVLESTVLMVHAHQVTHMLLSHALFVVHELILLLLCSVTCVLTRFLFLGLHLFRLVQP